MKTIQLILPLGLGLALLIDYIAFPKRARRAWLAMSLVFIVAGSLALFPEPLMLVADFLGVGRPVDVVLYVGLAIMTREFFLSRIRDRELHRELTTLTRELAIARAQNSKTVA